MKLNTRIFSKLNLGTPGLHSRSLLFFLYINDLVNCTSVPSILLADGTCLSFRASCPTKLIDDINTELNTVYRWMKANILAQTSTALSIPSKLNLQINSNDILYSTRMKISVSANQRSTWEYILIVTLTSSHTYNFFAINSLAL